MKKINKKGFTLIELLVVIVVLAILIVIATVAMTKYVRGGKDTYNDKLKDELLLAGKQYYGNNKNKLPTLSSKKTYDYVTLPQLKDGRYLTNELVDSEGRDCSASYVYVKQKGYNSNNYEYIACLICEDAKGKIYRYNKKDDPHCNISNWSDETPPTCNNRENDYYAKATIDWTINDANDDKGINYIIIREKKNGSKNYKAIDVKGKTIEEIRRMDIKKMFQEYMSEEKNGEYEVVLIDQGGNETKNSCIDFLITKNSCVIDWSGDKVIIKKATTQAFQGFDKVYFQEVNKSAQQIFVDISGRKIENMTLPSNSVPAGAAVFLKDKSGNTIQCDSPGVPVCEFTKTPGNNYVGTNGTTLEVTCTIIEGTNVKKETKAQLVNKNLIKADASKNIGTLNTNKITHNGGTEAKAYNLVIKIPYAAQAGKTGTDTITFGAGTVRNAKAGYENKINRAISTTVKVDGIAPTISYNPIGTLGKATAINDSGTGYYNSVTVTATCTDNDSKVDVFKINSTAVASPYSVTFNTRGSYSLSGACTDKAGNSSTKTGGPYRVLKQVTDCTVCGIAEYASCPNKAACGCK